MITKLIRLRDSADDIPCAIARLDPGRSTARELIYGRSGYGPHRDTQSAYVALWSLDDGYSIWTTDPHKQTNSTLTAGHYIVREHFNEIQDGDEIWVTAAREALNNGDVRKVTRQPYATFLSP